MGNRGPSTTSQSEGKSVDLKDLIRAFIYKYPYLHEFRLQKLIYVLDLIRMLEKSQRVSQADFKPYMYGSYSEDIRKTLEELEDQISFERDMQHGKVTKRYVNCEEPDIDDEIEDLVNRVKAATKGWSNEDLGEWSKNSWLYRNTPYENNMNFGRILVVKDRVSDEMDSTFSKLDIELSDEE